MFGDLHSLGRHKHFGMTVLIFLLLIKEPSSMFGILLAIVGTTALMSFPQTKSFLLRIVVLVSLGMMLLIFRPTLPHKTFAFCYSRYWALNTRHVTPGCINTFSASCAYVPNSRVCPETDGVPMIVIGIKSIEPDTGNVAAFSNRKALSLEALPSN